MVKAKSLKRCISLLELGRMAGFGYNYYSTVMQREIQSLSPVRCTMRD